MMIRKRSTIFLALTILLAGLGGCKSSRETAVEKYNKEAERTPTTAASAVIANTSPERMVENLIDSYKPWQDVSMSVKCKIRAPKSMSVSGKAVMVRAEEVRISMRMLGFEVAGLYIDRDSAYIYEKLNHTMIVEPMSKLQELSGLTLSDLQDILLGHICYPECNGKADRILKKMKVSDDGQLISLMPRSSSLDWKYVLTKTDPIELLYTMVSLGAKGEARCSYSAALQTSAGPVSPSATLTAEAGKYKLDATLEWSLETASWNSGVIPKNNVPKGYRRISLQQLIKALSF